MAHEKFKQLFGNLIASFETLNVVFFIKSYFHYNFESEFKLTIMISLRYI